MALHAATEFCHLDLLMPQFEIGVARRISPKMSRTKMRLGALDWRLLILTLHRVTNPLLLPRFDSSFSFGDFAAVDDSTLNARLSVVSGH